MDERIFRLIRKSLALANNNSNVEEAQTALLKAQELMAKHSISMSDVTLCEDYGMGRGKTTQLNMGYMRLFWYHKRLARIVDKNFRVYNYINRKGYKSSVFFFGFEEDVAIAKEVYLFALAALEVEQNDWGLVLVKDALVIREYKEMSENFAKGKTSMKMLAGDSLARHAGYIQGNSFDHQIKKIQ